MYKKKPIIIVDYTPKWAEQFEILKGVLLKYVKESIISIEHVGSTSVEGLKAKPIIDLDIIVENEIKMKKVIQQLNPLGYIHIGNLGVSGREAFKKVDARTPNDGSNRTWFDHHLYLCKKGSIGLQNHLSFRTYMRKHPNKVLEYGRLKQDLAVKFPYDIDAYIDGKTEFIIDVLHKAGIKADDTTLIHEENKLK